MISEIYQPFIERRKIREFLAHTHISAKNRYIYFGVSKAANSTIKFFLQQLEYLGTPYKVKNVHNKHLSPLLSPYQLGEADLKSAVGQAGRQRISWRSTGTERAVPGKEDVLVGVDRTISQTWSARATSGHAA